MNIPSSTYRIQFHKDFTFKHLHEILDYLHALGISTIYASPILKSTKGSTHGYDGVDPQTLDPEIGTEEEFRELSAALQRKGMTWLQDIVPNHMAFDSSNFRLMDVLERGPASSYYHYFDILWDHPEPDLHGKVMVPFLGDELQRCLERKEIKLTFVKNGFRIVYFDSQYPVSLSSYDILFFHSENVSLRDGWHQFLKDYAREPDHKKWISQRRKWFSVVSEDDINKIIDAVNSNPEKLANVLSHQYYLLAFWKQSQTKLNYRRFFTVNQLICLQMDNDDVFRDYHSYFHSLYKENVIQGCRIDHIDGLLDPSDYLVKLRGLLGNECYIIIEKILEAKESIPPQWPVQGTSGYEFLSYVNQLLTHRKGSKELLKFYRELVGDLPRYEELVFENKKMILETYMQGDWDNLVHYFFSLNLQGDFDFVRIKEALGLLMISMPVYRIYPDILPLSGKDLVLIKEAFQKSGRYGERCHFELDYLQALFIAPAGHQQDAVLKFMKRVMQFTGPLTAKGVEDSTFYVYNPLISHDEVGDSPSTLGIRTDEFHTYMKNRQSATPLSLNATSTHDTKRGEDVRIRLNIVSQLSEGWQQLVKQWFSINKPSRTRNKGNLAPTTNDEYFIYQSIVGGFPEDLAVSESWIKRLQEYLVKVVREAKVNSNWESPNDNYEKACTDFIEKILSDDQFISSVVPFVQTVVTHATVYSLAQTLIKITAPGIPDIYQGCELWDLSYVDPDNRREVDYKKRKMMLQQIQNNQKIDAASLLSFLEKERGAGAEKLFVSWKTLNFRKQHTQLFTQGEYLQLQVTGSETRACVFVRSHHDKFAMIVVPLGIARRNDTDVEPEAAIILTPSLPKIWNNIFTGKSLQAANHILPLNDVLNDFPVALLFHE